jgi:hypothetical protein
MQVGGESLPGQNSTQMAQIQLIFADLSLNLSA